MFSQNWCVLKKDSLNKKLEDRSKILEHFTFFVVFSNEIQREVFLKYRKPRKYILAKNQATINSTINLDRSLLS